MSVREQQKINTKHKISKAATKLSKIYGIDNLKVREICKEAKISIGTFYNYYDSIQSILIDSIIENFEMSKLALDMVLVNNDEIKNFEIYIKQQVGSFMEAPVSITKEVFRIFLYYPEAEILALNRTNYDIIRRMIDRGKEKGQITKANDSDTMTKMILKLVIANCFLNAMHNETYDFTQSLIDEVNCIIKIK